MAFQINAYNISRYVVGICVSASLPSLFPIPRWLPITITILKNYHRKLAAPPSTIQYAPEELHSPNYPSK
ncbi:hypothetical protein BDW59DRAFT_118802 [Aspergillus cavernicola]|uniref:Uncharacterized protein n=1 Tax=Aspergillus cavernicola TaxID=176166 RepID=A0ABR4HYZ8_9EURO